MPVPLSNRRRKEIASLVRRKYRERHGQMLVEGLRSVASAFAAEAPLVDVVVSDEAWRDPAVRDLVERMPVPVYTATAREMDRLSDVQTSQGVLAVVETSFEPLGDVTGWPRVLALDGLQDPGNVGTVLRTAAWFGVDGVLTGPGTVDVHNPKVVRAAMGGLWDLRLARTDDLAATLAVLRGHGFACYGADMHGTDAAAWQPAAPSVLVLGNEAHGLDASVAGQLDERVVLAGAPGRRGTESLNVAVAAGILLYEWLG